MMKELFLTLAKICFAVLIVFGFWVLGALIAQGGLP